MRRNVVRGFLIVLLFSLNVYPLIGATISKQKRALIDELMSVSRAYDTGTNMLVQIVIRNGERYESLSGDDIRQLQEKLGSDPDAHKIIADSLVGIHDEMFSEAELRQLLTFFKSDVGRKYVAFQLGLETNGRDRLSAAVAALSGEASDSSKIKRTMADLRNVATATEAYATDNNLYPRANDIEELPKILSPIYIKTVPLDDAWGKRFVYRVSPDLQRYRFVSGGPDGWITPASLTIEGTAAENDDIIFENGVFVQAPK